MKKVVFIRHAKSSWDDASLSDKERPLNTRGLHDAPKMAKYLSLAEIFLKLVMISSPAKRALQTAKIFATEFGIDATKILTDEQLYYGNSNDYFAALNGLDDTILSCFVFGHNPIIEHVVSQLSNPHIGQVPTCSMYICHTEEESWMNVQAKSLTLVHYSYPKML